MKGSFGRIFPIDQRTDTPGSEFVDRRSVSLVLNGVIV